jgi:hypothetical protein
MPKVDSVWDHRYEAGTWADERLEALEPGGEYELRGVEHGDGKKCFDPTVYICFDDADPSPPAAEGTRRILLPPPKSIRSGNFIPISPLETFENPDGPGLAAIKRLATLTVLGYDCKDLNSARLMAGRHRQEFHWVPRVVTNGEMQAVNLHVFAEPYTFRPLAKEKTFPVETAPFNVLVDSLGACFLKMKPPGASGGSFFADIDPGAPIPGLPEPEKLSLSQHAMFERYGTLHRFNRPINCGGVTKQKPCKNPTAPEPAGKAFALLRNKEPKVLADPHVVVVHWGSTTADAETDKKVTQLLNLPFIQGALAEYGVNPPRLLATIANPEGSPKKIEDAHRSPATLGDSALARGLRELIHAGKAPDPRQDTNLLFLIVAAPEAVSDTSGVRGSHNFFYLDPDDCQTPVRYAWALQTGSTDLSPLDNLTWTLSHEFLEACTDPEPPTGWVFEGPEVCDIAAGLRGTVDGIVVTGYYSYKDGGFKKPEGSLG